MKTPAQVDALDTDIEMIYTKTLIFLIQHGLHVVGIGSRKVLSNIKHSNYMQHSFNTFKLHNFICERHETDVTLNCIGTNINGMGYYFCWKYTLYYIYVTY